MIEDVVAQLVLVESESSWDRLREIETALRDLWPPPAHMYIGGFGTIFPLSVDEHEDNEAMMLDDIREFVVRGQVTEARKKGALGVAESAPVVAVCMVAYPVPGQVEINHELERIADGLRRAWPAGFEIEYSTVHHPGLPLQERKDADVMEFKVVRV